MDVDGVLTDGKQAHQRAGRRVETMMETKAFDSQDGIGACNG